jgi:heme exporter protein A
LNPPLLEARELTRRFGPVRAVDGISFALEAGEVLTILGPNGAGKTTLLGLLSGTLHPTSGEIRFRGEALDATGTEWRSELGLLSHRTFVYGALSARENLLFWARLHGLESPGDRVFEALAEVGLTEAADRPARGFSRGMRQRLSLARTLLHDPALVLLDEPFTGLDLHAAALLRAVLQRLRDGRRSVVLVTHQLAEGIGLADRVAIQSRGRFAFLGAATDLPAGEEERFYRETVEGRIPLEGRIPVEGAVPVGGGPPAADGPLAETAP